MVTVTQTKFAELAGRSRSAIWQNIKRGTLNLNSIKKLDTEDPLNKKYLKDIEDEKNYVAPDYSESEKSNNELDNKDTPEKNKNSDPLVNGSLQAKRGQEVLKFRKLELELKELEGKLIRKDLVASACFDYLAALNINIMEMPQSFLDEFESATLNESPRVVKMDILTKPICDAISLAISQIEKKLKEDLIKEKD